MAAWLWQMRQQHPFSGVRFQVLTIWMISQQAVVVNAFVWPWGGGSDQDQLWGSRM
jgi:hypothetical protein